jgi:hypothetical protein
MNRRNRGQHGINWATLYWSMWIFGTILVVLSWFRVVSALVGWTGFIITGIATLVSVIFNLTTKRRPKSLSVIGSTRPSDVMFSEDMLQISLADGRTISVPLAWYPKLAEASTEERTHYELDSNGVYWPDLDVDVSVLDILDGVPPVQQ